jgi:hypothetical protein
VIDWGIFVLGFLISTTMMLVGRALVERAQARVPEISETYDIYSASRYTIKRTFVAHRVLGLYYSPKFGIYRDEEKMRSRWLYARAAAQVEYERKNGL